MYTSSTGARFPSKCRAKFNWIFRKSAEEDLTCCLFPSCCVNLSSLADGDKQLVEPILQVLPLNHHRRRGHNEMRSLKELRSKLKWWKTTWRTWWKCDFFSPCPPHRSDVFFSFSRMLHGHHHSVCPHFTLLHLAFIDTRFHLSQEERLFLRYFEFFFCLFVLVFPLFVFSYTIWNAHKKAGGWKHTCVTGYCCWDVIDNRSLGQGL